MRVEVEEEGERVDRFLAGVEEVGGDDDKALDEPEVGEVGDEGDTMTESLKE